ncbi:MAG TPA: hypothetical protein PK029_06865 [Bacteroidales bacterium]|nr:hypothetical protein [Bacteroidales bacterium]
MRTDFSIVSLPPTVFFSGLAISTISDCFSSLARGIALFFSIYSSFISGLEAI